MSPTYIQKLKNDGLLSIDGNSSYLKKPCDACTSGKMHRKPFKKSIPIPNDIGDVLYSDVCGPITPLSHGGSKYFVTFTDGASRYSWVYFLKARSDVLRCFKIVVEEIFTQTGYRVKSFHPDNAGEYTSKNCDNFLKSKGIIFAAGPPHTPQSNGVSERLNRTLVRKPDV